MSFEREYWRGESIDHVCSNESTLFPNLDGRLRMESQSLSYS